MQKQGKHLTTYLPGIATLLSGGVLILLGHKKQTPKGEATYAVSLPPAIGSPLYLRLAQGYSPPQPPCRTKEMKKDQMIISQLANKGYKRPREKGAEGDGLFYAMEPQVTAAEMMKVSDWVDESTKKECESWEEIDVIYGRQMARAQVLRHLAIHIEAALVAEIGKDPHALQRKGVADFVHLLYRGIRRATMNHPKEDDYAALRQASKETSLQAKWHYCQKHFPQYEEKTKRSRYPVGPSEAFALALALHRTLEVYGNDWASRTTVGLDAYDRILPSYNWTWGDGSQFPITIFQYRGGGHYQQLAKA